MKNPDRISKPAKRVTECSPGWSGAKPGVASNESIKARETGGRPVAVARFTGLLHLAQGFPGLTPWALCFRPRSRASFGKLLIAALALTALLLTSFDSPMSAQSRKQFEPTE